MFSYASNIYNIYKSSKTPFQHGQLRYPGLQVSYLPLPSISTLGRCGNSLSPHLNCYPSGQSGLEVGRKVYVDLTIVWCQIQSCT